jgi:hypothetical protein
MEAPNHLRILTAGGAETVIIGKTRYGRDGPGKPWKVEHDFPVTPAPAYVWDYFAPPVAPRILGGQRIGGHPTRMVAFFGRSGEVPVWFRLWVDQGGLVRHARCSPKATSWTTTTSASTPPSRSGRRSGEPLQQRVAAGMAAGAPAASRLSVEGP